MKRFHPTTWAAACTLCALMTGSPLSGATLVSQSRAIESYANAFSGGKAHEDIRLDEFHDAGEYIAERFSESNVGTAQASAGVDQKSNIAPDLFTFGASVVATVNAPTPPEGAGARGDSRFTVYFDVTEPEHWALGLSAVATNHMFPPGVSLSFELERDEETIREFESDSEINHGDAMTLAPGRYRLSCRIIAQADSSLFPDGNPSARADFFFRRHATPCLGDVQGDRQVDFYDLNVVLAQYGLVNAPGFLQGDVNDDGTVDFVDLNIVLSNYGVACPA